jgi:Domain of unknown function (DUF4168)
MMNCALSFSSRIQRLAMRSLMLGTLSSIAVLAGWAPNFSAGSTARVFDSAAYAQDSAFTRYVKAAFEIEKTRQGLLERMKQLTGGNVPANVCQSGNIAQMNPGIRDQAKTICDSFAAQAMQIVQRNQLSRDEFNNFQRKANDPAMRSQIEAEVKRLGLR